MNVIVCNSWTNVLKCSRARFQLRTLPRYGRFTLDSSASFIKSPCKKLPLALAENGLMQFSMIERARYCTSKLTLEKYGYQYYQSNVLHCSDFSCNCIGMVSRRNLVQHFKRTYVSDCKYNSYARGFSTDNQRKYSDINYQNSWIALWPKQMQSYLILARVDRPIGYWLLFFPCSWSISLAAEAGSLPNLQLLTLFFVGSILMRSAGCVINDLWDADLDKQVARTSSRPLASGEVSTFQGLVFLGSQLSIALGILLSLNNYSIVLGASSLVLVTAYPLMKRITFWPQLFLGATINWGCLLGWSAVSGSLDLSVCLPLYLAAVNWTLFYDTIYSFQDVNDDRIVGIKSTSLLLGDKTKPYLSAFGTVMIANLLAVGINSSQTWPFYLGLFGVSSHLAWQLYQLELSQPKDCLSKFKSNKWLGVILMMSIIISTLIKPKKKDKVNHGLQ